MAKTVLKNILKSENILINNLGVVLVILMIYFGFKIYQDSESFNLRFQRWMETRIA